MKREPGTARRQARSRRRRGRTFKLTPLGEIVVDVGTLAVAAIAFAPEITAALATAKKLFHPPATRGTSGPQT